MVALQKYKNKKIAIYGMGITGCSVAKNFKKINAQLYCWDDNKKMLIPSNSLFMLVQSFRFIMLRSWQFISL